MRLAYYARLGSPEPQGDPLEIDPIGYIEFIRQEAARQLQEEVDKQNNTLSFPAIFNTERFTTPQLFYRVLHLFSPYQYLAESKNLNEVIRKLYDALNSQNITLVEQCRYTCDKLLRSNYLTDEERDPLKRLENELSKHRKELEQKQSTNSQEPSSKPQEPSSKNQDTKTISTTTLAIGGVIFVALIYYFKNKK